MNRQQMKFKFNQKYIYKRVCSKTIETKAAFTKTEINNK